MKYVIVDVDRIEEQRLVESGTKLRPNFTVDELACKDGSSVILYSSITLDWLQAIRDKIGPIHLTSAFRTPEYNSRINGANDSMHMYGRAVDITKPSNMTIEQFYNVIEEIVGKVCGIGKYKTFIHLDSRGHEARWNG